MKIIFIFLLTILIISKINKKTKIETFENQHPINKIITNQNIEKIKYQPEIIRNEYLRSMNSSLLLLEIKNNKLAIINKKNINPKVHMRRIEYITSLLEETLLHFKFLDIIFILSLRDNLPNLKIPFLGPVYEEGKNSLAIPNNWWSYFTKPDNRLFQSKNFDNIIKEYINKNINNTKKDNRIVFRGTNNCELRRKVRNLGKKNSELLDVQLPKGKNDKYFIPNNQLISDYQYYFVLRGRGKWTGSMNQFALAEGVLFKVEEESKQPIELFLEPDIDYVSIKNDLSDFNKKIQLSKDKKLMNQMKINLKNKSDIFFKSENIMYYMYYKSL